MDLARRQPSTSRPYLNDLTALKKELLQIATTIGIDLSDMYPQTSNILKLQCDGKSGGSLMFQHPIKTKFEFDPFLSGSELARKGGVGQDD